MKLLKNFFSPEEFTGWHMVGVMCLFFGTIISVNLFLAYQANHSWTGLVVKNSYHASQTFDKDTKERQEQLELGWKAVTNYEGGRFEINLVDAAGQAISNVQATAMIGRPAHENDDRKVILSESAKGRYVVDTPLASGLWQADITVAGPTGAVWNRSVRFVVKG